MKNSIISQMLWQFKFQLIFRELTSDFVGLWKTKQVVLMVDLRQNVLKFSKLFFVIHDFVFLGYSFRNKFTSIRSDMLAN